MYDITYAQTQYCKPHSQKMAAPLFDFGLTHAPLQALGLDREYSIVGKYRWKAATAYNERFGAMAGVPRYIVLQNSKLSGSWQVQVARHFAKPPPRCAQANFIAHSVYF
jgi:hypothetical protein